MANDSLLSSILSRKRIITAAGIAAAAFIGYCIYSNHKKRPAPDFKQRILERYRATVRQQQQRQQQPPQQQPYPLSNPRNAAKLQSFFLIEIIISAMLLQSGNVEDAMDHFCNVAAIWCETLRIILSLHERVMNDDIALYELRLGETRARLRRVFENRLQQVEHSYAASGG